MTCIYRIEVNGVYLHQLQKCAMNQRKAMWKPKPTEPSFFRDDIRSAGQQFPVS
jgi:hypothetical protein